MDVYVTRWFGRWARREGIPDRTLCRAVGEMERGLIDANLGGGLYKKRIAAPGRGKRGSHRTLLAFRSGNMAFFVFGFAKNEKDDIDDEEKRALKKLAKDLFAYNQPRIAGLLRANELRMLRCHDE